MSVFVDTHAHLAMLEHSPLQEILTRARSSGIKTLVTVSVDEPSWENNRKIAEANDEIYYSLGLHPHEANRWVSVRETVTKLLEAATGKGKCVGVGETGLDFFYNRSTREEQVEAFEDQIALSKKFNLPIIIHCRDAFQETYASIRKLGLSKAGGVMHCFTGNTEQAKEAVSLGLKISLSGILTFKTALPIQDAAKALPLESIVLETDCPFLAPVPHRGKPNEPSLLIETAKFLAALRGVELETIAHQTTLNAQILFGLS